MRQDSLEPLTFWAAMQRAQLGEKVALTLSSWFFCGLLPGVPGTFGTLGAILPAILIHILPLSPRGVVVAAIIGIAVATSSKTSELLNKNDPPEVVIDEVAGYLLATFALPLSTGILALSFVVFRVFDILKPFPIRQVERRVRGGLGIVLDDLLAGLYTLAIVGGIVFFL
ncbi:MAG: phosphatidylglycerophosphatase A [Deltaproteobacteria bacterium]|nr:phosphatidylglycerophosphatase A [Deltaproteobacteria bacterium]MBW1928120.1 phosphatidylglycerophosphatase A [Deltaproteobacteria bacterium]MBW2025685.1 phosphatidylglycerophosphatase A [Deltaproteobacteria bacterium]MBW2125574.1 phosphatidylglycerophosphatase A [Deltaproteobacteria bacterium]RLB15863.1 MAG: phosphatidylglycerophosphatase A [Deltaproteobacteria bacterium]